MPIDVMALGSLTLTAAASFHVAVHGWDNHFAVEDDSSNSPNGERPGPEFGMRNFILPDHKLV